MATREPKNPIITVLLNSICIIMGLGYLYIGDIRKFVIVFIGLQLVGNSIAYFIIPFSYMLLVPVWLWTLYDGYVSTVRYNDS